MPTPATQTPEQAAQASADVAAYIDDVAKNARAASLKLLSIPGAQRDEALRLIADAILATAPAIQKANAEDLKAGKADGLSDAMLDRLALSDQCLQSIADSVRQIADQPDPVGQVLEGRTLPNGIRLSKQRVPIGVVLIIFESRPNVTVDAAALCLKSGNAAILRGGKEAVRSNLALAEAVRAGLRDAGLPGDAVHLINTTDRAAVSQLLTKEDEIDLCIPRGGESLIRAVVDQSRIPVIKHYTGLCHTYVHHDADPQLAIEVCVNAKTQRTGVCNATECFLLHKALVKEGTAAKILRELADQGVELRGDETAQSLYSKTKPATAEDYRTEYLSLTASVKFVDSIEEAVSHINRHGSRHTDAILTASLDAAQRFTLAVDTANVMVNCSTRFSDGGQYGLGAEIGISTDKLHARGPMGAADLTTSKWVCQGNGQTRH